MTFGVSLRVLVVSWAIGSAAWAHADVGEIAFTDDERARIAKGEAVVSRREPPDGKGIAAQAAMVLDGTPDEVWPVIDDCAHFKDFMPRTKSSEEKLREPGHSICRVEVSLPFPLHDLWSETDVRGGRVDGGGYHRTMNLREGSYRKFHAAWDLVPQAGARTLVIYRVEVEPDTSMPDSLLRVGQQTSLPDTFRAIQKRVLDLRASHTAK